MAESVDALVSNTSGVTRAGSTPAPGTALNHCKARPVFPANSPGDRPNSFLKAPGAAPKQGSGPVSPKQGVSGVKTAAIGNKTAPRRSRSALWVSWTFRVMDFS